MQLGAGGTRRERAARLVLRDFRLQLGEPLFGDVREVGDDAVKKSVERSEQVALHELGAGAAQQAARVFTGDAERGGGDVGGDQPRAASVVRDGDAQRARAGPHIGQPRAANARLAQVIERGVDEQLGFGAGD